MDEHAQETVNETTPTCYRHPERETWVSCGRCGKPLCPDCMMHGPVGIRCRECLLPSGGNQGIVTEAIEPAEQRAAVNAGAVLAGVWVLALIGLGAGVASVAHYWFPPNLLFSGIAGGTVGWLIRKRCQGRWNTLTTRAATLLGLAIPLIVTAVIILLVLHFHPEISRALSRGESATLRLVMNKIFLARAIFAAVISAFFAWLLSNGGR